jgi:hypothetical protein
MNKDVRIEIHSMIITEPVFMKLVLMQQLFMKNAYTEFYENPTDCLITDTGKLIAGRTDGHYLHAHYSCFDQFKPLFARKSTCSNAANSLYFYNMFRPVIGHYQEGVHYTWKRKLYQNEVLTLQKLDTMVILKLLFQKM